MWKKNVTLGFTSLIAFSMAACSSEEAVDETTSTENEGTEETVLEVSYPTWWESWFKELETAFESENENVNVELIPLQNDVTTKQAMMMKSPETSPDVAVEDTYILNSDVNAGYLSPMDEVVSNWDDWDQFEDTIKQGVTAEDGKIYGVPFSTDVQGLWYNKALFEKAGLSVPFQPESWEEVLAAAEAIKSETEAEIPLFMYTTKSTGEATSMRTFQVLYSGTGSELYSFEEGKWVVDEEALTDTFAFIDQVNEQEVGADLSIASNSQVSTLLAEDLMMNDEVAMVMDGNWVAASWREGRATPWPEALDTWGFTVFPTQGGQDPGFTSMSGGWALSIPENADNKELAAEFIKMAVSQEEQLDYVMSTGDMTVRKDVSGMEEYLDQPLSIYREAAEMLKYTNFRPAVDDYAAVSTLIQEVVEAVASGSASPEEAVERYATGLERIVGVENIVEK